MCCLAVCVQLFVMLRNHLKKEKKRTDDTKSLRVLKNIDDRRSAEESYRAGYVGNKIVVRLSKCKTNHVRKSILP